MEMHQLRYVVAVARTGNFSRAAEQCNVSQPSLSQQMQKLEEELGERLFERTKRLARLTPHGELFLQRAVRILQEVEAAQREAGDAKKLVSGKVQLGVLPTIAPYLLPGVITRFARSFPGVEVVVQEDTTARLLKLLAAWEIDFALASEPVREPRMNVELLFEEELLLALPPQHRLAGKRNVSVKDLEQERFILMQDGHCLGDQVLQFCSRRELQANVSFRSAQLETVQSLVRAGMGISMVPEMAAHPKRRDMPQYRSLQGRPARSIVAVWPHGRPPGRAARQFLNIVRSRSGA